MRRRSHPTWVRGLKLAKVNHDAQHMKVAPYMGAWIETPYSHSGYFAR